MPQNILPLFLVWLWLLIIQHWPWEQLMECWLCDEEGVMVEVPRMWLQEAPLDKGRFFLFLFLMDFRFFKRLYDGMNCII